MDAFKPKILILYASYGDGHLQVARALEQSFARHGAADVKVIDLLAEAHPLLNALTRLVYLRSSAWFPAAVRLELLCDAALQARPFIS
ncbi:hypothetical protein LJK88_05685 [Paenibacillus sp. P26]|nr:hypothetical protein LJK88_05685 [Paenibacillus sp. P26]